MTAFEQLSFWERNYVNDADFLIIGSGIVGLTAALSIQERNPEAHIVLLERSYLPAGASTKNAGFACFGSPTELMADMEQMGKEQLKKLVKMRYDGLQKLQHWLNPQKIDLEMNGNHELFMHEEKQIFEEVMDKLPQLNQLVKDSIGLDNCYANNQDAVINFRDVTYSVKNQYEGQLHTGKMMQKLIALCHQKGIFILNGINVEAIKQEQNKCTVATSHGDLEASRVIVATNGFATKLVPDLNVKPARGQVMITKPFTKLPFEGAFHLKKGFYYMRTIGQRILIGGGRNLAEQQETTTDIKTTDQIKEAIEQLLNEKLLPAETTYEVEHCWAGIMGVGNDRFPYIEERGNMIIGVKMGGMGIALGSAIGEELANLAMR